MAHRLFEERVWTQAKRIGCYLSMPHGELQTDEIVQRALEEGACSRTRPLP